MMAGLSMAPAPTKKKSKPAKRRQSQEERSKKTVNKLLKATIDLLLADGYSKFRIADAAAKAKVSRGGQTHHFATKKELVEAAIERLFASKVGQAQDDAASTVDSDVMRHAAQHSRKFFSSKLYRVSLNLLISVGELEHLADGVRAISARSRVEIDDAWLNRIAQLGATHQEAEAILGLLWSVQRGLFVSQQLESAPDDECEDELDFVVNLLNEHLERKGLRVSA